jgi:hypothetical protein
VKLRVLVISAAIVLASCGKSGDSSSADGTASAESMPASGSDTCALVADANAVFGQPITANPSKFPDGTKICEWKAADGMICGSATVFGPGYNEVAADAQRNFGAMTTSMGAFGEVKEVAGLGEEAKAVDGKFMGGQVAFRKGKYSVLVGGSCTSGSLTKPQLAENLARAIAEKL